MPVGRGRSSKMTMAFARALVLSLQGRQCAAGRRAPQDRMGLQVPVRICT